MPGPVDDDRDGAGPRFVAQLDGRGQAEQRGQFVDLLGLLDGDPRGLVVLLDRQDLQLGCPALVIHWSKNQSRSLPAVASIASEVAVVTTRSRFPRT